MTQRPRLRSRTSFTLDGGGPLFRQLAGRLAYEIATGRRRAGENLPSLRRAQTIWKVSMHTVRRTYRELQSQGLVAVSERGKTIVTGDRGAEPLSLREFAAVFLGDAAHRFGATPAEVSATIRDLLESRPEVFVAECSRTLASSIAAQLSRVWTVNAIPCLIDDVRSVDRPVVSTLFHLGQLRREGRTHAPGIHCLRIRPAAQLLRDLSRRVYENPPRRLALCERDPAFAAILVTDLREEIGRSVEISVHTPPDIDAFLDRSDPQVITLVSPGCWDRLSAERAGRNDVVLLDYDVEPSDVTALGERFGWQRAPFASGGTT